MCIYVIWKFFKGFTGCEDLIYYSGGNCNKILLTIAFIFSFLLSGLSLSLFVGSRGPSAVACRCCGIGDDDDDACGSRGKSSSSIFFGVFDGHGGKQKHIL